MSRTRHEVRVSGSAAWLLTAWIVFSSVYTAVSLVLSLVPGVTG